MEHRVFRELCAIAHESAGIMLQEGKEALVAARVARRIRALGLASERAYLQRLRDDDSGEELRRFVDVISTNVTSFMREPDHFDTLARAVQDERLSRRLRLWCAAAATGEEPYTIAITLLDAFEGREVDFKILATDISTQALTKAANGRYSEKTVAPLSRAQRTRYLQKCASTTPEKIYEVLPAVKERIVFRRLNLSTPPFPMKGPLDVVFCRNVMIYFDTPVRQALVAEIGRLLAPGGLLFTGHAEALAGLHSGLKVIRPSVYQKPGIRP